MQKKAAEPSSVQKPKTLEQTKSESYLPIASLNPYIPSWKILARVVQKGTKKTWSTPRGNGVLFNIVLKDKSGDEIRGTFFNDEVDKFYDKINVDKIYAISGGRIKNANKKYNNINHDYGITFDKTTTFEECENDQELIGENSYNFTPLKELENIKVNKKDDTEQPKQQIMRNKAEEDKRVDNKEEENQKENISILSNIRPKNAFSFGFTKQSENSQKEQMNGVHKNKEERKSERRKAFKLDLDELIEDEYENFSKSNIQDDIMQHEWQNIMYMNYTRQINFRELIKLNVNMIQSIQNQISMKNKKKKEVIKSS